MQIIREVFSYGAAFLLSCGPAQVFGLIKGAIDYFRLSKLQSKIAAVSAEVESLQRQANTGIALLAKKAKKVHLESKLQERKDSLFADCLALIPFVGAIFSWRVFCKNSPCDAQDMPEYAVKHLLENHPKTFAQLLFYPLAGQAQEDEDWYREAATVKIGVFDPKAKDNVRFLTAKLRQHDNQHPRPTVVLFHGNMMTGDQMSDRANMYFRQGYDVLCPTMGGFPGSDPVKTCEESSYRDVEGIKRHLERLGVKEVGFHGLSIGGSLAFQAAVGATNAKELKVKFVMAEQTFTSAIDAAANVAGNTISPSLKPFARGVARASFPQKRKIMLAEDVIIETDGLDNRKKAELMKEKKIPLFVMKSTQDHIMGRDPSPDGNVYLANFADDLLQARYDDAPEKNNFIDTIFGGHCESFRNTPKWRAFLEQAMPLAPL